MKKILSFMASLAIGATATSVVTSCGINDQSLLAENSIIIMQHEIDVPVSDVSDKDNLDKIWGIILDKNPDLKNGFEVPDSENKDKYLSTDNEGKTYFTAYGAKESPYRGYSYRFEIRYV